MEIASPIPEFAEKISALPISSVQQTVSIQSLHILDAILNKNWEDCQFLSEEAILQGDHLLKTLRADMLAQRDNIVESFRRFKQSGFLDLTPQEIAEHLDDESLESHFESQFDIKKAILLQFKQMREEFDESINSDVEIDLSIALMSHGLKSLCQSLFNQHCLALKNADVSKIEADETVIKEMEVAVEEMSTYIDSVLLEVYSDLLHSIKKRFFSQELYEQAKDIEVRLPIFFESIAKGTVLLEQLRKEEKITLSNQLGKLCAKANDLTREAICSYISLLKLSFQILQFKTEKKANSVLNKAHLLAFDCSLPDGKNTTLNKFNAAKDKAFVEVSGFVESIKQRDLSDESLMSELTLKDLGSGTKVTAAIRFIHLKRMGVMPGAYVTLHGQVNKPMTILDGNDGIRIGRVPHATLAAKCWRLAFFRIAAPWYPRWRHGLNMMWSITPHLPATDSPDELSLGANEIIYSPFLRA